MKANRMVKNAINAAVYAKAGGIGVSAAAGIPGAMGPVAGVAMGAKVTTGTLKLMGGSKRKR